MQEAKDRELELIACLLTNDSVTVSGLKKQLAIQNMLITVFEGSSINADRSSSSLTQRIGALPVEPDTARTTNSQQKRAIRGFSDRVCTGYSSLVRAQSICYRDRLDAVHANAQMCGEYLGRLRV